MDMREQPAKEKIILPQNLQREMIKFFLKTSIPKIAAQNSDKDMREIQQKPPIQNELERLE